MAPVGIQDDSLGSIQYTEAAVTGDGWGRGVGSAVFQRAGSSTARSFLFIPCFRPCLHPIHSCGIHFQWMAPLAHIHYPSSSIHPSFTQAPLPPSLQSQAARRPCRVPWPACNWTPGKVPHGVQGTRCMSFTTYQPTYLPGLNRRGGRYPAHTHLPDACGLHTGTIIQTYDAPPAAGATHPRLPQYVPYYIIHLPMDPWQDGGRPCTDSRGAPVDVLLPITQHWYASHLHCMRSTIF